MKLNPRTIMVGVAKARIALKLNELQEEYELTDIEMIMGLLEYIQSHYMKYFLRQERHPEGYRDDDGNIVKGADDE